MKNTQRKLMFIFLCLIGIGALLVVLSETDILVLPTLSTYTVFVAQVVMEFSTIICIPLALRLFAFRRIHQDLITNRESALMKWGLLRMLLLQVPMLVNLVCYYMSSSPAFGYLAIILFLCLFFINPSESRCRAEIEKQEEK